MNKLITDLAKDVAAYYSELCGRDMPAELAEQLTRDYQLLRLSALYGGSIHVNANFDVAGVAQAVREELIRIGDRRTGLSGGVLGGY